MDGRNCIRSKPVVMSDRILRSNSSILEEGAVPVADYRVVFGSDGPHPEDVAEGQGMIRRDRAPEWVRPTRDDA